MSNNYGAVSAWQSDSTYRETFQRTHDLTLRSTKVGYDADSLLVEVPGDDAREGHYVAFGDP